MKHYFTYKIAKSEEGLSILDYLKNKNYSRHLIIKLKKTQMGITIDGKWAYVNHILKAGEVLVTHLIDEESSKNILPVPVPFEIIYEDEHLLIVNKPADTPIHPSMGNHENTLANGIAYYFQSKNEAFVYRCVNRLDRDTTGLLIIAKHLLSSSILSDMVKTKAIQRQYLALAEGHVPASGTIHAPIGRMNGSTIERCIDYENGETAITHYKCLETNKHLSLVSLQLETGRTHQIRVHMKHIGHPLIGDFLYNPNYENIKRQALHSYHLEFEHPITSERMNFYADLPEDMKIL
jgi:23S rRNA pseudouridine1911/1915/1917 synthase